MTVIPGLIDSHALHCSVHEYDHAVPPMHEIADVLGYIKQRAELLDDDHSDLFESGVYYWV